MNTNLKILLKLTTRSRPDKAFATIKSIVDNCNSEDYHIHLSIDVDDATMTDKSIVDKFLGEYNNRSITVGESKNKIDAINRDMDKILYDWDILVNCSDDQLFIKKGFDDVIRDGFVDKINFSTNLDLFLHFNDGNQNKLATMSIMGRTYYERDNYIYHPSYKSLFCDNEAQDVAVLRGCYKAIEDDIFVHNHPAWGKAQFDEQYRTTEAYWGEDEATYNKRKSKDFKYEI